MSSATAMQSQEAKNRTVEAMVHKLKLNWMMAKDEAEKRRISEEIRRLMSSPAAK